MSGLIEKVEDALWCGRRIGDLSRDELLEVIDGLANDLKLSGEAHDRTLRVWEMFRQARKALG